MCHAMPLLFETRFYNFCKIPVYIGITYCKGVLLEFTECVHSFNFPNVRKINHQKTIAHLYKIVLYLQDLLCIWLNLAFIIMQSRWFLSLTFFSAYNFNVKESFDCTGELVQSRQSFFPQNQAQPAKC